MKRQRTNIPASVRQRLQDLAKERNEDFSFILTRFVAERLLYRLSNSAYSKDFILKGAMLFLLWNQQKVLVGRISPKVSWSCRYLSALSLVEDIIFSKYTKSNSVLTAPGLGCLPLVHV